VSQLCGNLFHNLCHSLCDILCDGCVSASPELNEMLYTGSVDWEDEDSIITGLTSIAICGIEDPVRPEVSRGPPPSLEPKGEAMDSILGNGLEVLGMIPCSGKIFVPRNSSVGFGL